MQQSDLTGWAWIKATFFTFQGRMSRDHYWEHQALLFVTLGVTLLCLLILPESQGFGDIVVYIGIALVAFLLFIFIWLLSVMARRLQDLNIRGFWAGVFYVFGLGIVNFERSIERSGLSDDYFIILSLNLLYFGLWLLIGCIKGTEGENRFGPDPRGNVGMKTDGISALDRTSPTPDPPHNVEVKIDRIPALNRTSPIHAHAPEVQANLIPALEESEVEAGSFAVKAQDNNAESQFNFGFMCVIGKGREQDYEAAALWFRKAAEQGLAKAQFNLGMMSYLGAGVTQDYKEAVRWFRKAADQGLAKAQFSLGRMCDNGEGVLQDYGEAVRWWRKSAEQGNADAEHNLGLMYWQGKGVAQDYVSAHKWLNLATAQGKEDSRKARKEVEGKMNAAQVSEAQRLAREFKPKK